MRFYGFFQGKDLQLCALLLSTKKENVIDLFCCGSDNLSLLTMTFNDKPQDKVNNHFTACKFQLNFDR